MGIISVAYNKVLYPLVRLINRIDSRLFIFIVLCLNFLTFNTASNEEAYFALAKQYFDPAWIPGSFTFTEWVGTRFLFQNIAGWALSFLTFEQLTFWGRFCSFLLLSFPVALVFKELRIKNAGILMILQLYISNSNTQHFFGMEWIFGGFESKTLAYIFIFYGYYFLLKSKFELSVLFAALASYFHVLVGGWFFVLVFLYACIEQFNLKTIFRVGAIYVVTVLPLVIYMASYLNESGSVIHGVDIDWVYSFFRNTHHTAPMHEIQAMNKVLPRVIVSFGLLLLSLFYFRKSEDLRIRKLNRIALIALGIVFTGLIITYIDVHGHLLKYYWFRIAAIGAFTYYIIIFLFLENNAGRLYCPVLWKSLVIIFIGTFFLVKSGKNINRLVSARVNPNLLELVTYVQEHTQPDDVYLFLGNDEESFSRRTRRDAFVIFKFDPGGGEKIYEWYMREQMRRELRKDLSYLDTITSKYRLNYLITTHQVEYKHLREVYHNRKYYLYEVVTGE